MKISEIKKLDDADVVKNVSGRLTQLYPPKTGTGEHGSWSYQNGILKDDTGEIKVVFSNKLWDEYKGLAIKLSCYKSDKHGWLGVKVHDNEYEGKTTRELRVSETCSVDVLGGEKKGSFKDKATQSFKKAVNGGLDTHHSIVKQVAFKGAIELACKWIEKVALGKQQEIQPEHCRNIDDYICAKTDLFYNMLIGNSVEKEPEEVQEEPPGFDNNTVNPEFSEEDIPF